MSTTVDKLLGYLPRPYRRDAGAAEALSFDAPGTVVYLVDATRVRIYRPPGFGSLVELPLDGNTVGDLVDALQGASYTATVNPDFAALGLRALIPTGTRSSAAAVRLMAATSWTWHYYATVASLLAGVATDTAGMLRELRLDQAAGEFLDIWLRETLGGARLPGEVNNSTRLRNRIRRELTRIRCNNRALERDVAAATGVTVRILEIPWALPGNALHTYGGPAWNATQVTNSAGTNLVPAFTVDTAVVARFGLVTLPDGRPAYGDPLDGVPLQAVMAVIFPDDASLADRTRVLDAIEPARAAGVVPLTFKVQYANLLLTNTAGNNTNDAGFITGPQESDYYAWP